jgi:hypothetical protein
LVVASRRESEWKGVSPAPRLQIRRLTEFGVEVIHEALHTLAQETGRSFGHAELDRIAGRVHKLSEGLPALLAGCLDWIRQHDWDEQQLTDPATFEQIARPYIARYLLSPTSLSGHGSMPGAHERAAIEQALLKLSPYRFLTVSHLSEHIRDPGVRASLTRLGWSVADLWSAVSGTDLLYVPLREPWHEVYAPIRRLLCRHAYPEAAERSQAHRAALAFLQSLIPGEQSLTPGVYGSDQCRVLVECLWHETEARVLAQSTDLEAALTGLAGELCARLSPSAIQDQPALREVAARFLEDDQELAEAVSGVPGLFERLVHEVRQRT